MIITGTRFGNIDYSNEDVIHFPDGMIGFDRMHDYVVINTKEGSAFRWLQSLEEPKLAFLVSLPESFMEGYSPEIKDEELKDVFGMAVTIVTTAKNAKESFKFFEIIGVPFKKEGAK